MEFIIMQKVMVSGLGRRPPTTYLGKLKAQLDEANEWFENGYTVDKEYIKQSEIDFKK